jgi:hypothetical protein
MSKPKIEPLSGHPNGHLKTDPTRREDKTVICSAKGCRNEAAYGLLWNNPKLHKPERRKVWLACEQHADPLSDFLSKKGFMKDAVPVAELTDEMG